MRITMSCLLILTLVINSVISDEQSTNLGPKDDDGNPDPPFAYAACNAKDTDGVMTAQAHISVDIDYVLEPRVPGVQYRANSNVSGTGDHGKEGTWNCYAYVPNDDDPQGDSWWLTVNKGAKAEWKDYYFILDRGDVNPVPLLSSNMASAGINGTHSGVEYEAIADAWNFF